MLQRPSECSGCPLNEGQTYRNQKYQARGFSQLSGPSNADILIVGEALGKDESYAGQGFVGPAGQKLNSLLSRAGIDREDCRIGNSIFCQPPNDWLVGAPYEKEALNHCQVHRQKYLDESHKVIITTGATATRTILGLSKDGFNLENWHGCVTKRPDGKGWVVPTFHPSHLLRGQHKLTGTCIFDLSVALEVATGKRATKDPGELVVDPPIEWFTQWVDTHLSNPHRWLAIDIETPGKINVDEGDLEIDPSKSNIVRINFSNDPNLGITVPWTGRFIDECARLLSQSDVLCMWNERYDNPILEADFSRRDIHIRSLQPRTLDFQWGWHVLQSDLPKGLGFVAPFYSGWGAWKHLSGPNPGRYAAIDAIQTIRCSLGIAKDLQKNGQWEVFTRHIHQLDTYVLRPAEEIGLLVDQPELQAFTAKLQAKEAELVKDIREITPQEACKVEIKLYKKLPKEADGLEEVTVEDLTQQCQTCQAVDVSKKHVCKDEKGKKDSDKTPRVTLVELPVTRWKKVIVREFLPSSDDDVRRYMEVKGTAKKGKVRKGRKTDKSPVDEKALKTAYAKTKDSFYSLMLQFRSIAQQVGTAEGMERRIGEDGRLHPHYGHHPSTLRLSCRNPNLNNQKNDDEDSDDPAQGIRRIYVASDGCDLIEADSKAIEAVIAAVLIGDKNLYRLALLGIYEYVTSHFIKKPVDMTLSDEEVGDYLKQIKKTYPHERKVIKKGVLTTNYGGTAYQLHYDAPDLYPTLHAAKKAQAAYTDACPTLAQWWTDLRTKAHREGHLENPFHYRHWYFNVFQKRGEKWALGEDAKRLIAFTPQSTAAGILYDSALELVNPDSPNYVGDMYYGKTPFRALVYDSFLAEVQRKYREEYCERVRRVMTRPIEQLPLPVEWNMGEYLSIGCEIKSGKNWLEMAVV